MWDLVKGSCSQCMIRKFADHMKIGVFVDNVEGYLDIHWGINHGTLGEVVANGN